MTQYAIVTDLNRCVGCMSCMVACKAINDVAIGNYWNKIIRIGPNPKEGGSGHFPDVEHYYLPIGCQHCEDPECVKVCPTEASHKVADGTVQIDKAKCIGCQFCVMSCPYGVRYLNQTERVVEKCTLCEQRTSEGYLPQCVAQCAGRARYFGDLEKGLDSFEGPSFPEGSADYDAMATDGRVKLGDYVNPYSASDVYALPDAGNHPSFRYILRDRKWQGNIE